MADMPKTETTPLLLTPAAATAGPAKRSLIAGGIGLVVVLGRWRRRRRCCRRRRARHLRGIRGGRDSLDSRGARVSSLTPASQGDGAPTSFEPHSIRHVVSFSGRKPTPALVCLVR